MIRLSGLLGRGRGVRDVFVPVVMVAKVFGGSNILGAFTTTTTDWISACKKQRRSVREESGEWRVLW